MAIMTHPKFHFNRLMLTLISGIRASEPPPTRAWRTTEKARPGERLKRPGLIGLKLAFVMGMEGKLKLLREIYPIFSRLFSPR